MILELIEPWYSSVKGYTVALAAAAVVLGVLALMAIEIQRIRRRERMREQLRRFIQESPRHRYHGDYDTDRDDKRSEKAEDKVDTVEAK
jgi:hypothetical protein